MTTPSMEPTPSDGWAFPVPGSRFDQKYEMFKRSTWDPAMEEHAQRFYRTVEYQKRGGYRRLDYAFRNASWNLEWGFGMGNSRSNSGLYAWEGVPERVRQYLEASGPADLGPREMSRVVKKAATFYGADLVGIGRLHPNWVYSHEYNLITREHYPLEVPEGCDTAIVLAVAMDYEAMRSSPTGVGGGGTGLGYSRMAFVANLVAAIIRGLGYRAIPCGNDTALSVPLAMEAGLGESSRMGLLVTEAFGPRVRLCKVLTDLPLARDSYRPFGVEAFCRACTKCAARCPSQAIPAGEMSEVGPNVSNQSGCRKWYVDAERCFAFWARNRMDCAVCIRVCPFNKPPGAIHRVVRAAVRRTPVFDRLFARLDDLFGYGRPLSAKRYWGESG